MVLQSVRPGAHASVRNIRVSAFKARPVLRLIQGESYEEAVEILKFCERGAADVVAKCLRSAAANAEHNEGIDPEELFVFSCFADEGPTLRRWRPRARGRATRIHKRTCHITIQLMRYTPEELAERAARESTTSSAAAEARRRRVAASRGEDEAEGLDAEEWGDEGLEDAEGLGDEESLEDAEALDGADDADILTPALEQAQNDAGLEDIGALGDPEGEDSSENSEDSDAEASSEVEEVDAEGTEEADDAEADSEAEASSGEKKSKSEKSKSKDS